MICSYFIEVNLALIRGMSGIATSHVEAVPVQRHTFFRMVKDFDLKDIT